MKNYNKMHDDKMKCNCSVEQLKEIKSKQNKRRILYNDHDNYDNDEQQKQISLLLIDNNNNNNNNNRYCTSRNIKNHVIEKPSQITTTTCSHNINIEEQYETTIKKEVLVKLLETTVKTTKATSHNNNNDDDNKEDIEKLHNSKSADDITTTCNYKHVNKHNINNNNYNNDDNNCSNKINQAFNFLHVRRSNAFIMITMPFLVLSTFSRSVWSTLTSTSRSVLKTTKKRFKLSSSSSSSSSWFLIVLLLFWSRVLLTIFSTTTTTTASIIDTQMSTGTSALIMMTSSCLTSRVLVAPTTPIAFIITAQILLPRTSVWAAAVNPNNNDFKLQQQQQHQLEPSSSSARQLQQQQLFALLTQKQRKEQQLQKADIGKSNSGMSSSSSHRKNSHINAGVSSGELLRKSRGGTFSHNLVDIAMDDDEEDNNNKGSQNEADDEDDTDDDDVNALSLKLIAEYVAEKAVKDAKISNHDSFLETTGFVADDGQQYEKVEKEVLAALNGSSLTAQQAHGNKCPKACQCLNDYFDCGKLQLEHVPELPEYVEHLNLVGNRLNESTALQIKNLPDLHKLSLKRNQLEHIPKFVGLIALKHLNLANNLIKRIDSDALAVLPKLKSLDLTENYLHSIEANFFPTTNRLAHLILKSNEIALIEENALESLVDLLELELDSNELTFLPNGVFKNLNKLKKLSLNFNQLEINWSTFRGLHVLQKLYLKSNRIRALQDGVFHVMRSIETIELDHNGITSLSRQGLFNLTKLHHLSLSNNSIMRIEPDTWEFTQSLVTLDLSHNNISDFRPQHLDCLQRLRHLNLGHNRLHYIMDTTFDCVKNLEDLNLRRNQLSWIIEDQFAVPPFRVLRKLKKLDLFGNNLKQITGKALSGLNNLETLNLGGNALANIQSGAFDHLPHLQKLMFKSFNFICDCELVWFKRWLQRHAQGANAVLKANAICGYPEDLLDRELLELTTQQLICAESPKPVITQEPSNQLAVKGANITMECIANSPASGTLTSPTDELKIKWRHDNQNVRDRHTVAISSAPSSAMLNAYGSASAAAVSKEESSILSLATAHAASHKEMPPQQSFSYTTTETQIHMDPATNQTTIIGYLKLYNVSYESAGRYQCVVTNSFGTTYSQKFKISIGIHPTFSQIPSNMTIDSGDTARLVCSATGDPMPEIALQKFGASDFPAATERRLQVIREENAFVITNAKPIDTGIYTCTADSAAGEIKINATLVVNDKPLPHIPVVHKEVVLGQSSVLKCINELTLELASPHREWYKDNKPFHTSSTSDSERYYFTTEKEFLVIDDTQSMDAGHYRCEIHDQAKNYIMQMELLVVKAGFSENVIIIVVALLTVLCIVMGSLVVWCLAKFQKRKLNMTANGGRVGQMSDSRRASVHLDQTQLTTLNRTYLLQQTPQSLALQQQQQQQQQPQHKQQMRPRSLADLEYGMSGGRGLLNTTPTEELSRLIVTTNAGNAMDESRATLEYLEHNNQDYLSSKDSGTGSDAAVKRSIDDFTMAALVGNGQTALPPPKGPRAALAKMDTYRDDKNDEDDDEDGGGEGDDEGEGEESDFTPTRVMGVSMYEVDSHYSGKINERTRFLGNSLQNNSSNCKTNLANNLNNGSADNSAQTVDI